MIFSLGGWAHQENEHVHQAGLLLTKQITACVSDTLLRQQRAQPDPDNHHRQQQHPFQRDQDAQKKKHEKHEMGKSERRLQRQLQEKAALWEVNSPVRPGEGQKNWQMGRTKLEQLKNLHHHCPFSSTTRQISCMNSYNDEEKSIYISWRIMKIKMKICCCRVLSRNNHSIHSLCGQSFT